MNNIEFFIVIFSYWAEHFGYGRAIVKEDKRIDCPALVETIIEDNKSKYNLIYNSKYLSGLPDYLVLSMALHEVGHLIDTFKKYETIEDQAKSEYRAERWSLDIIKEYYPDILGLVIDTKSRFCQHLLKMKCQDKYKVYYLAFREIPEYGMKR